ncbi:unnamed protein product [marine sediment metagenome]|uniref:Uncharacterized protein n=1 Tax=marine sediment metagenome TaxID=412755 RepID=X1AJN4_9ZZZZ
MKKIILKILTRRVCGVIMLGFPMCMTAPLALRNSGMLLVHQICLSITSMVIFTVGAVLLFGEKKIKE